MNSSTYLHQYILWWYVVSTKDYAKKLHMKATLLPNRGKNDYKSELASLHH